MIWIGIAALSALAVFFVIRPILSKGSAVVRDEEVTPAILLDQLDELERDKKNGLLAENEAADAQLEVKRRILSAARRTKKRPAYIRSSGRIELVVCALFVPVLAFGYYFFMGAPSIPALAFADRQNERDETQKIADLTNELLERLNTDPSGGPTEGWQLLGRTYMKLGRFEEAAQVFQKISKRPDSTSAIWSMLAEALISSERGVVTPRASEAIAKAVQLDPDNPAATFYQALSMSQSGREVAAYELLVERLGRTRSYAPWMDSLVNQANRIGNSIGKPAVAVSDFVRSTKSGPTEEDMRAAQQMSDGERSEFIRSMVSRLASRLEDEPEDLEGWLRLANAYTVLGERDLALGAYERADDLLRDFPESDPRRGKVKKALSELQG